jgi:hypothetical protein
MGKNGRILFDRPKPTEAVVPVEEEEECTIALTAEN